MTRFVFVILLLCGSQLANAQQYEWPRIFRPAPVPQYPTRPTFAPPFVASQPLTQPVVPPATKVVPAESADVADPPSKDVPPTALWEVQRRGNMVQELGEIQANETNDVAEALAIPPDDSHKWFITVVTMQGCRYCDKLLYDFIHAPDLQAWVLVDRPLESTCHYQVRKIEDTTQRDWFAGIGEQLRRGGFPAIVIQPPRNGKYGPNKTVVAVFHGYDGVPKRLSDKMTAAITKYVATLRHQGKISEDSRGFLCPIESSPVIGGFCGDPCPACKCDPCRCPLVAEAPVFTSYSQEVQPGETPISGPPPFVVPPKPVDPVQPSGPVQDWPAPQPLTLDQLKAVVPTAPVEFLLKALEARLTDPASVLAAFAEFQKANVPNEPTVPSEPKSPLGAGLWTLLFSLFGGSLIGGMLPSLALWGLDKFRKWKIASGQKTYLNENQYRELRELIESLKTPNPPAS